VGNIFQVECWARHPSVGVNWFIMAKALERKNAFLAHLFMKIMEVRRKGR